MTPRQLSFDLPVREALGREDFFVSPANAEAVAMVEAWQAWPGRKLVLTGPRGAGKTHLAHVWAAAGNARIISADTLQEQRIEDLAAHPVAVEDADRIAGNRAAENSLFHLHNLVLAEGHSLLLTALRPPRHWPLTLPDLASRLEGSTVTALRPPDDALLAAILMKLFADRQVFPSPDTIPYLTRRMERSFAAAQKLVEEIDDYALETKRPVTRALAAGILEKIEG